MAAEGHVNIKVNGSVRLVGDVPTSRGGARTTTSVPPEMSTTFIETTTTLSTTTTRKQRSPPTIQVRRRMMGKGPGGSVGYMDILYMVCSWQVKKLQENK